MSDRVGAQSASELQCCGTPKFKQTNYLLHLLELSEGFSLSSVQGVEKFSEEEAGAGDAQPLLCPHHSGFA